MTENHHFQIMLHQIEQARQQNPSEARRRAHLREAQRERRLVRTNRLRNLVSGIKGRSRLGSSAPCRDASAPC